MAVVKAKPGQKLDEFVREAIMDQQVGLFEFNNYQFELKGGEEHRDFFLIMADYYLQMARKS
ncbi:hypothetical protein [Cohnella soli]|uniref:Uncharacterized protein n=1 Tax=Cohnella soli TaxID=425005 RepID=A0ABW0HPJ5_9BACL